MASMLAIICSILLALVATVAFPEVIAFVPLKSISPLICRAPSSSFGLKQQSPRLDNCSTDLRSISVLLQSSKSPLDCLQDAMDRMHILQHQPENLLGSKQTIRVGTSSIENAGDGVFATKNIKSGTIIGLYPIHTIGLERFDTNARVTATDQDRIYFDDRNIDSDVDTTMATSIDNGNTSTSTANHNYLHYLLGSRPLGGYQVKDQGGTLFIDVNPANNLKRNDGNPWISHYINDGAIVATNTENDILEYYRRSGQRKNCVNIPFGPSPFLVTVTCKKVKKGEELFTTYGGSYWVDCLDDDINIEDDDSDDDNIDDDDDDELVCTDAIQDAAKQTAKDIFEAMQTAQITQLQLEKDLDELYNSAVS